MKNSYSKYIPYQLAFFDNLCQKNLEKIVNLKNRLFALFSGFPVIKPASLPASLHASPTRLAVPPYQLAVTPYHLA